MVDTKLADCWVEVDRHVCTKCSEPEHPHVVGGGRLRPMSEADLDSLIRERGVTDEMVDRAIEAWESAPEYQTVVTTVREMLLAALTGEEE